MTVKIKSKRPGFRRCGIANPDVMLEYPDDRFTSEELKRLKGEPMLIVEIVEGEPETETEKEGPTVPIPPDPAGKKRRKK